LDFNAFANPEVMNVGGMGMAGPQQFQFTADAK
jgi:hypothetical protein